MASSEISAGTPALVRLGDLAEGEGGGKAAGLRALLIAGLEVPPALVIREPSRVTGEDLAAVPGLIGPGPWAVRSSAPEEDGAGASFAGQFSTYLNIDSIDGLSDAIRSCAVSAGSDRVATYRGALAEGAAAPLSVVVQRMVAPRQAGVIFTADPVTGDADCAVIEAVHGLGEALVGGESLASRCRVDGDGRIMGEETAPGGPRIGADLARELARQARFAAERMKRHLDLEWAVDDSGRIFWLQARPITTLEGPGPGEFDYPAREDQFFTRANIGEMMPGAVTPLTMNVFGDAVDFCIRYFYRATGSLTRATRNERFVVSFGGHLFLNLNQMFLMADRVLGSTRKTFERNLLGHPLDDEPAGAPAPFPVRFVNGLRMGWYVSMKGLFRRRLEKKAALFNIDLSETDPLRLYKTIERRIIVLNWAYAWHLCVSTHSGGMNGILREILRKGGLASEELDGALTWLLADIEGIESAAVVRTLEEIAAGMAGDDAVRDAFRAMAPEAAARWFESAASGAHGAAFRALLARHGHRCIREAELREKDWGEDPSRLIVMLQRMVSGGDLPRPKHDDAAGAFLTDNSALSGRAFRWAVKQARSGVFGRERCKSLVIRIQSRFKHAYRRLASILAGRGVIPDEDLIFFFTRGELGEVVRTGDPSLVRRAVKRRRLLPGQMALRYPDVFRGAPGPLDMAASGSLGTVMQGMPVSAGIVQGPVRMVFGIEDAESLRRGEIMVAAFTDIGWTPYYSIVGGLVTEVGCMLSHGAVVAREYGLPMITAVTGIMSALANGDLVEIDGRRGTVTVLERAPER